MIKITFRSVLISAFLLCSCQLYCQLDFNVPKDNPVELGKVNWLRNYDKALELSKNKGLPVFILFQEVPGCSTCTSYGKQVLSHPFLVEAIETYFIPLAIFNNKGGSDKKILDKYKEPTWNNPVVRIVNEKGENLVDRLSGNYSQEGVLNAITIAMIRNNQIVPNYLKLFQEELTNDPQRNREMYLSMYCFWTGEKELGKIPGVFQTASGFMHGREVVKVEYNPDIIQEQTLIQQAARTNCADQVFSSSKSVQVAAASALGEKKVKEESSFKLDREQKYYLLHSDYKHIPMTDFQAMKVNSALGSGLVASDYLSPRQLQIFSSIKKKKAPNTKKGFEKNWYSLIESID